MDIYHGYLNFDDITDMQAKRDNAFLYGCRSTKGLFCVRVYVEHDTDTKVSVINCETATFR